MCLYETIEVLGYKFIIKKDNWYINISNITKDNLPIVDSIYIMHLLDYIYKGLPHPSNEVLSSKGKSIKCIILKNKVEVVKDENKEFSGVYIDPLYLDVSIPSISSTDCDEILTAIKNKKPNPTIIRYNVNIKPASSAAYNTETKDASTNTEIIDDAADIEPKYKSTINAFNKKHEVVMKNILDCNKLIENRHNDLVNELTKIKREYEELNEGTNINKEVISNINDNVAELTKIMIDLVHKVNGLINK